jgi:hypothetical protein
MAETENKKAAALKALQEIRERVKPVQDSSDAPKIEEATLRLCSVQAEEEYLGIRIRDDPERGLVQVFFRGKICLPQ